MNYKVFTEKEINSNIGIFKQIDNSGKLPFLGPNLDKNGDLIGNAMALEVSYFSSKVSDDQYKYYEYLCSLNNNKWKEYILVITKALSVWKDDIKWLQVAEKLLEKEEDAILNEEKFLEKGAKIREHSHLPIFIKNHFPQIFEDSFELDKTYVKEILVKIKKNLITMEDKKIKLQNKLEILRKEFPFLFN